MNMRKILIILFSLCLLTSCMAVQRVREAINEPSNGGFVPNLPDVPMPKNFVADANTSSFFDSAEGRIAEINAEGFAELDDVEDFYNKTLPQFGWKQVDRLMYKKEGELLVISAEKTKTLTSIKYQLRPSL